MFKESLKHVLRKFQVCGFKKVSEVSFGRWMGVSEVFKKKVQGCFKEVFRCFKDVSRYV